MILFEISGRRRQRKTEELPQIEEQGVITNTMKGPATKMHINEM